MIEGDTIIMGYNCKKAQTQFRGREWLVWYTMDIPISEGPWKLCGLPGMILQAEDRKGLFTFCCIGIKSHVNEPLVPIFTKAIKSTFKKVQELMTLYYSDHERYKKATGFNYQMFDKNNKPYVTPKRTACLLEE
jgi:GLPGLI family protein